MFGKKKEPKITWVMNAVHQDGNGMKVTPTGVLNDRMSISELEKLINEANKKMFERLREDIEGHEVEVGVFASSFVHIVHEDENADNEQWQETKRKILGDD